MIIQGNYHRCTIYIVEMCGWSHVKRNPRGIPPSVTSAQAQESSQAFCALHQRIEELNTQQLTDQFLGICSAKTGVLRQVQWSLGMVLL